jgi:hypothetical protein
VRGGRPDTILGMFIVAKEESEFPNDLNSRQKN